MTFSDEDLMAYADGELDDIKRKQIEDAIQRDPAIARRVESHRALANAVRTSFEPILAEPVPDRLISAARSASHKSPQSAPQSLIQPTQQSKPLSTPQSPAQPPQQSTPRAAATPAPMQATPGKPKSNVVPLRGRGGPTRQQPRWLALAASFMLGVLALQLFTHLRNKTETDAQLIGSDTLQRALSAQLASDRADSPVQIGVSYLSKSGSYCRTFQLHELSGLACNDAGSWKLQALAKSDKTTGSQYKPAASSMPPAIIQAVNDTLSGEPLDSNKEAEARAQKWQHAK